MAIEAQESTEDAVAAAMAKFAGGDGVALVRTLFGDILARQTALMARRLAPTGRTFGLTMPRVGELPAHCARAWEDVVRVFPRAGYFVFDEHNPHHPSRASGATFLLDTGDVISCLEKPLHGHYRSPDEFWATQKNRLTKLAEVHPPLSDCEIEELLGLAKQYNAHKYKRDTYKVSGCVPFSDDCLLSGYDYTFVHGPYQKGAMLMRHEQLPGMPSAHYSCACQEYYLPPEYHFWSAFKVARCILVPYYRKTAQLTTRSEADLWKIGDDLDKRAAALDARSAAIDTRAADVEALADIADCRIRAVDGFVAECQLQTERAEKAEAELASSTATVKALESELRALRGYATMSDMSCASILATRKK